MRKLLYNRCMVYESINNQYIVEELTALASSFYQTFSSVLKFNCTKIKKKYSR